jgi:hypothetical protein
MATKMNIYSTIAFIIVCPLLLFGQRGATYQGFYANYESVSFLTYLNQTNPTSNFNEEYLSEIYSYPSIKLGYSFTAWGNAGMSDVMKEWAVWGIDLGVGISYSKSIMNGYNEEQGYFLNDPFTFQPGYQNQEVFFNFYQPGNLCKIDDYGLNLHFDAGTILYAGLELDAGPSRIIFTDSYNTNQRVKSLGWFANATVKGGISIPWPWWIYNSKFNLNMKVYAIAMGWSARYYKLDWMAEDKKLKNFTTLETNGSPLAGLGFSLTFLFD